ncbi:MAG: 4-hydroxybenzoate octaprenyltransferase [Bacteroidota bacterium]
MTTIKKYLSLIKFSHTIFAMPFAMIGFFLGVQFLHSNHLSLEKNILGINSVMYFLILVILCMVFARSAAMAFNRYLDYKIDAINPRTAVREIPSGVISPKNALIFTLFCCLLFVACTYAINKLCFYLSFVALFVVLFYSYTKRFTALCHLILGLGLSLAPIGAFVAVTGIFKILPVLISLLVLTWVSGFDIIYALQDEEFDKKNNLNSIPALLGKKKALQLSSFLHLITALLIITVGIFYLNSIYFWIGAFLFMGMLIYQHSIVKPDDLRRVNLAFMTANGIASVVFAFFVILDIFLKF